MGHFTEVKVNKMPAATARQSRRSPFLYIFLLFGAFISPTIIQAYYLVPINDDIQQLPIPSEIQYLDDADLPQLEEQEHDEYDEYEMLYDVAKDLNIDGTGEAASVEMLRDDDSSRYGITESWSIVVPNPRKKRSPQSGFGFGYYPGSGFGITIGNGGYGGRYGSGYFGK